MRGAALRPDADALRRPPEFWLLTFPIPGVAPRLGVMAEEGGFDGVVFADTQNLAGDPYAELCLLARATTRLELGTGVTNPVTRHPAVTASSIATVQVESNGRAVLGIGRGDSSLGYIGRGPASVEDFELYVERVQRYLGGESVDLDGFESRNNWITNSGLPKVPVDVAATGPRVIGVAARHAERITFAVGAEVSRVGETLEFARSKVAEAGRDADEISFGAYVNVAVNPDVSIAREVVRGGIGSFAHFSGMRGASTEGISGGDREVFEALGSGYDMEHHGMRGAAHAKALDDAFIDRFGVVGAPELCIDKLGALLDLGLDRLVVVAGSRDADPAEFIASNARLTGEVIPPLRKRFAPIDSREDGDRASGHGVGTP